MSEPSYLWFAPHAGLWPVHRMEHRLADSLARAGRQVTLLSCQGLLATYCPVMAADGVVATNSGHRKERVCRDCRFSAMATSSRGSYRHEALDSYVDADLRGTVADLVARVTHDNWSEVVVDGISVGRYAAYTTMLNHKVPDPTASEAAWQEYLADLGNALTVAVAMPRILDAHRPTHAVVYNALYPTSRVFAEASRAYGAQLVGLHAGSFIPARTETVGIYQHVSASQTLVDSPTIRGALETPCTPGEIVAVTGQMREQMSGNDPWVYSAAHQRRDPHELRRALGVRPDSPVVVALLSSPDETRSSMLVDAEYHRDPERGYSDVAEFIDEIRALAAALPDVDVAVRLHPRLLPNKRESVSSPDLAAILEALGDLPANAHVNAPGDGVSLYDVIGIANAGLNQSSSSGLEFLALGLPVVSYDPVRQNAYPPEFGPCAVRGDRAGLEAAVRQALAEGASLDHAVDAFRWYASVYLRAMLHLSPIVAVGADIGPEAGSAEAWGPPPAAGPTLPVAVRRIVPEAPRAAAARWLARRARPASIPEPDVDAWWRDEWLMRLDATVGDDVIWRPPIVVRGTPDPDHERERVAAAVAALRERLGFAAGRGFGPVADL